MRAGGRDGRDRGPAAEAYPPADVAALDRPAERTACLGYGLAHAAHGLDRAALRRDGAHGRRRRAVAEACAAQATRAGLGIKTAAPDLMGRAGPADRASAGASGRAGSVCGGHGSAASGSDDAAMESGAEGGRASGWSRLVDTTRGEEGQQPQDDQRAGRALPDRQPNGADGDRQATRPG
ncbi:MAG: hypothetical protein MZU84_03300 [Sphingobacterium sp.]|nr:hypothetical protein [Sphingobacterium sp.]